jgi:hypothetical protein
MVSVQPTPIAINEHKGVSFRRPIDAAKESVQVIDLADRLCGPGGLRRVGGEWVACCPLRDHDDRIPSFSVNPEKNVWFCFGCLRGGDVVTLAQLAWNYAEGESHIAAADLLHEFGHDIPQRPPGWFEKQRRQKEMRRAIDDARVEVLTRRLWKYVFEPIVADIEDPVERARCAEELWAKVLPYAARIVEARTLGAAS